MTHFQNLSYHHNSICHSKIRIQEHEIVLCPYNTGSHWILVFAEQYLTSGSIDQVETSPASRRAERLEIAGLLMENQGNTLLCAGLKQLEDYHVI
ncbi:UNVERIFIED_CONTAM: hypothetical protein FKN15_038054 [Acipenser sinensis]